MNKQDFFNGIDFEIPLSMNLIKRLYGFSIYDKDFLIDVLTQYENHGRTGVKHVYQLYIDLEEQHRNNELKPIARELAKRIDSDYERKVKKYESDKRKAVGNWHGFKGFPSIQ